MKYSIVVSLLVLTFDVGSTFDGAAARGHAIAHNQHDRDVSLTTLSTSQHSPGSVETPLYYSTDQSDSSTSCKKPTVTVTVGQGSTIWITTTVTADPTSVQSASALAGPPFQNSTASSQSNSHINTVIPFTSSTSSSTQLAQISLSSMLVSTSTTFQAAPSTSSTASVLTQPSSPQSSGCASAIQNKTNMIAYFGFNVVNTKLHAPDTPPAGFKTANDWEATFISLKKAFPNVNAVRMYATTDASIEHLSNALQALDISGVDLKILAGVWSDNYNQTGRFSLELQALERAIVNHGCDKIFAVSVGNEDLERVKNAGEEVQRGLVDQLVSEFDLVRKMLRNHGCCTPVTHTDTYNEIRNTANPWVAKLLSNVDQAIIANIFPYWENETVIDSRASLLRSSNLIATAAQEFDKQVWLGETGWPFYDAGHHNVHGTSPADAVRYFQLHGCQILSGNGTAFYYADWDEDNISNMEQPSWGVLDSAGNLRDSNLTCEGFKPDMYRYANTPTWLGGSM